METTTSKDIIIKKISRQSCPTSNLIVISDGILGKDVYWGASCGGCLLAHPVNAQDSASNPFGQRSPCHIPWPSTLFKNIPFRNVYKHLVMYHWPALAEPGSAGFRIGSAPEIVGV